MIPVKWIIVRPAGKTPLGCVSECAFNQELSENSTSGYQSISLDVKASLGERIEVVYFTRDRYRTSLGGLFKGHSPSHWRIAFQDNDGLILPELKSHSKILVRNLPTFRTSGLSSGGGWTKNLHIMKSPTIAASPDKKTGLLDFCFFG